MNIKIICVGKLKEQYWKDALSEYIKRISKYCDLEIIEVNEEKLLNDNESNYKIVINEEGKRLLTKINEKDYVIICDVKSKELDSIEFSNKLSELKDASINKIDFIIGGSYGLSDDIKNRANYKISFSKLTFPHQMFRVMLLEQIYRGFKIMNNEKYHK